MTTRASRDAFSRGIAIRVATSGEVRLREISRSMLSTLRMSKRSALVMPTLFTSTSIRP